MYVYCIYVHIYDYIYTHSCVFICLLGRPIDAAAQPRATARQLTASRRGQDERGVVTDVPRFPSVKSHRTKPQNVTKIWRNVATRAHLKQTMTTNMYTRSPLEDSCLFGPSPWKILATTYETKDF